MNYDDHEKTITTERLILRFFQQTDAEDVAKLCNNYNIYKNTLYLPYPYTVEDAIMWIDRHQANFEKDRAYEFAITDRNTGTLYGAIALSNNKTFNHGEIAYWIGEDYWGNGYATEAAEAITEYAFNVKNYHRVFARCFHTNPASGRVLEKVGMEKEGVLKQHVKKDGEFFDLVYYGILRKNT